MIESYFVELETAIRNFPHTVSYSLHKKFYNINQGFVKGAVLMQDESVLEFVEVCNTVGKIKYRYHYRRKDDNLIFRYDNAPHYSNLPSFPHHKHEVDEHSVVACVEPTLADVLVEIKKLFVNF